MLFGVRSTDKSSPLFCVGKDGVPSETIEATRCGPRTPMTQRLAVAPQRRNPHPPRHPQPFRSIILSNPDQQWSPPPPGATTVGALRSSGGVALRSSHTASRRDLERQKEIRQAKSEYLEGLKRHKNSAQAQAKRDVFLSLFGGNGPHNDLHCSIADFSLVPSQMGKPSSDALKFSNNERHSDLGNDDADSSSDESMLRYVPEMKSAILHTKKHAAPGKGTMVDVGILERLKELEALRAEATSSNKGRVGLSGNERQLAASASSRRVHLAFDILETLADTATGTFQRCLRVVRSELRAAVYDDERTFMVRPDDGVGDHSAGAGADNRTDNTKELFMYSALCHSLQSQIEQLRDHNNDLKAKLHVYTQRLEERVTMTDEKGRSKSALSSTSKEAASDLKATVQVRILTAQLDELRQALRLSNERFFEHASKRTDLNPKLVEVVRESMEELILIAQGRDPLDEDQALPYAGAVTAGTTSRGTSRVSSMSHSRSELE
eukprot:PhM_4_TR10618/c0_g1_i2/m.91130